MATHRPGPNGAGANAVTDTARQLGVTKLLQAGPLACLAAEMTPSSLPIWRRLDCFVSLLYRRALARADGP